MTNYKEILRLAALGIAKQDIAASCQCSRNTVRNVLNAAVEREISWLTARESSNEALRHLLFPGSSGKVEYRMFDFIKIQYRLGRITAAQVREFVRRAYITNEQADAIIGEA